MSITTCPTDIVAAPPERIWELLTQPDLLAHWSGLKLIEGPGRALVVGDRAVLGPGLGLRVIFEVIAMDPPRQFTLDAHLPFGVVNHEVVQISPLDPGRCRVTFN